MAVDATVAAPRLTVAEMVSRLEAGVREVQDGEGWRAYLAAMSRFHQYSTVAVGYSKSGNARVGRGDRRGAISPPGAPWVFSGVSGGVSVQGSRRRSLPEGA